MKKFQVTVTKTDAETGSPQGDASLAGAVYGIYKGEEAVDEAISKSFTLKDFDRQLAEMGYRINFDPNRKYWTIIGKGWQRPKRLYKLGEKYTNDRIMERISKNSYAVKFQSFSEPQLQVKVYRVKGIQQNASG